MSDDIVTRLKWLGCMYDGSCITCEAANEIENLRGLLNNIISAVTDEGKVNTYHRAIVRKHRSEWPYLWKQIDKAVKAVRGE